MYKKLFNSGFRKLIIYQRILEFVALAYKLTKTLPPEEKFGLISQMKRSAVSVQSNFVKGYIKSSTKEKRRFLEMSHSSLHELEAQADICLALKFGSVNFQCVNSGLLRLDSFGLGN